MPHKRFQYSRVVTILAFFALLSTACSAAETAPSTPTPTKLVVITSTLPPTQTPRPSATPAPPSPTVLVAPVEGQTTSQLNVRSGPSTDSTLLGQLQIFAKVQIVGKDATGAWWMIVYPESPSGTGWITAQYVQATGTDNVPVFNAPSIQAAGSPAATGAAPAAGASPTAGDGSAPAPSPASSQPAQSLATAFEDGDSNQSPAVSIALSKASVRSFNYNSDLSSPAGDREDWVQFRLDGQAEQAITVSVILTCTGSGSFGVELMQNNSVLQSWQDITCGHPSQLILNLYVSAPYTLHISPVQSNEIQKYINYTLSVSLQ